MFIIDEDHADSIERDRPGLSGKMVEHFAGIIRGIGVESGNRLDVMLALLTYQPSRVFWPVFHDAWPTCDGTWRLRHRLENDLSRHNERRPGVSFLSPEARAWFDALPDPVPVFRGCSRRRVEGLSWTVDRAVAAGFAKGHRGIRVPGPVVASATIPKAAIFGIYIDRSEGEVLLDPIHLSRLSVDSA